MFDRLPPDVALGVEVAEDRSHAAVVAAGAGRGDVVVVSVVAYVDPLEVVGEVASIAARRAVRGAWLDPKGPAANLEAPLRDAGIKVERADVNGIARAHGELYDRVRQRRLKVLRGPHRDLLSAAIQAGRERPLSNATAWKSRGAETDMSPALACERALLGVMDGPPDYNILDSVAEYGTPIAGGEREPWWMADEGSHWRTVG